MNKQVSIGTRIGWFAVLAPLPCNGAAFMGLNDAFDSPLEVFATRAEDVSADGSVVVGKINVQLPGGISNPLAFRWTPAGGLVPFGALAGGASAGWAYGVSADGAAVIGESHTELGYEAFRWTQADGIQSLGELEGGLHLSSSRAISDDGRVVVGFSDATPGREAFRWTESTGLVSLGTLGGGAVYSAEAFGASADGGVVVGTSTSESGVEAFRWTAETGMVGLGSLSEVQVASQGNGVSADGSYIVGSTRVDEPFGQSAFRWTVADGMVPLGYLPGGRRASTASAITPDGRIVVGLAHTDLGEEAFIWDASSGMRNLRQVLVAEYDLGEQLDGWLLRWARAISDDGRVIVGWGTNPSGRDEAWRAVLHVNSADFDKDGDVDGEDFLVWQLNLNQFAGTATPNDGDANGDGFVTGEDFLIWQTDFGTSGGASKGSVVPEPPAIRLTLLFAVVLAVRSFRVLAS